LKKVIKGIFATLIVVLAVGIITIPSDARTIKSYAQKSIFSVLGDSISSYSGYDELSYYAPSGVCGYNMAKGNMWWSIYTQESGDTFGWAGAASSAQVTINENDYLSFFYPNRISSLDNNGVPDYIAIYGGINDIYHDKSASAFYSSYNQLANKLHNLFEGVRLILIAPNYASASFDPTSSKKSTTNTFDNYINDIARNYGDYYVDLRDKYGEADTVDGLHPKESGMRKIAVAIEGALRNARGETGIDSIRADLDYDHYIVKVNAYDSNYDNLNFKFKLTSSKGEVIYDTGWQKNNCFYLDGIDTKATYTAVAEIDKNNDEIADKSLEKTFSNLVLKRLGGSVYNGVDYSNVYDFNYYVEHYGDLYSTFRNDPNAAIEHFVNCGINEGRQAKADFDVVSYRNRYADLRQAFGWNNLRAYYDHYRTCGKREGRIATNCSALQDGIHTFLGIDCSPIYDYNCYISNNPDVYNAFNGDETQVFIHFLTCGMNEGRKSCENFDVVSYRNQWADLRQAFGWNNLREYFLHYLNAGMREGRTCKGCNTLQNPIHDFFGTDFSAVYNYQYYIEHNLDVKNAFGGDDMATFVHFMTRGMSEGRRACEGFDVYSYRNQWSDLRQAFGWNNLPEYYQHYVKAGAREGRTALGCDTVQNPIHTFLGIDISPVYDYDYYKSHNGDLRSVFGDDDMLYFIHFLTSGMKEGRQGVENFNVYAYASNNLDLFNAFFFDLPSYYSHYINCGKREGRIAV